MNVFCSLTGLAKMVLFWIFVGVIVGVWLAVRAASGPVNSPGCSIAVVGSHPGYGVPGYREEVPRWKPM